MSNSELMFGHRIPTWQHRRILSLMQQQLATRLHCPLSQHNWWPLRIIIGDLMSPTLSELDEQ